MIKIIHNNKTVAKFESFEGNKAYDWITYKGWFITNREYVDNDTLWFVKDLP